MKKFDLNIEKVLENWETHHAIREVIANAIDEQTLTKSKDIKIFQDEKGNWHIRDYGRGLQYEHLTQNENDEKLNSPNLIGKFGVGLKDALATFDRRDIKVLIKSPHGDITLGRASKHDFDDIVTLHAYISQPSDKRFLGTEFILNGCSEDDIKKAKSLFLKFSDEKVLEKTKFGEILSKSGKKSKIYINGVRVAEEDNFLFSYNITSLTKTIRKALNRERTNVGRNAYSDRIKSILLASETIEVANKLVKDLQEYETGLIHDELQWLDVSVHACKILNSLEKVLFLTPFESMSSPEFIDRAKDDGYKVIIIPESIKNKISGKRDISGNPIRDLGEYIKEWNESFEFSFVEIEDLKPQEREVFEAVDQIFDLIGGKPNKIKEIKISRNMRPDYFSSSEVVGVWEEKEQRIIIKRNQLKKLKTFAATLLHETAHAISRAPDKSIEFESALTKLLGLVSQNALNSINKVYQ